MSIINANPLLAAAGGDYQISRSVRLRSSASAYFNRTFGTPTAQNTWTLSFWTKRGSLGSLVELFSAGTSNRLEFLFAANNTFQIADASTNFIITSAVFRDPSAWYHIVVRANGSGSALQVYVNGVVTTNSTTNNLTTSYWNASGTVGYIGALGGFSSNYYDGYLTEINFIDGQALTPSSFGETDTITGVWKPKRYTGTYGTNGFYLNFSDNSNNTAATIGKDYSGNGNNWTPNNISVTSGVTYDSMLDVPTQWADGGNGRGNYCTLNPLKNGGLVFSNANLTVSQSSAAWVNTRGTIQVPLGDKYYCEFVSGTNYTSNNVSFLGLATEGMSLTASIGDAANIYTTTTSGEVLGLAVDRVNHTYTTYRNSNQVATGSISSTANLEIVVGCYQANGSINFGQRPFAYTPPTGFKALNTQNLPDSTIKKGNQYFNAVTWTGDGVDGRTITGVGFNPDLVWAKGRSNTGAHVLADAVRGTNANLYTNLTDAETNPTTGASGGGIGSVTTDGFVLEQGSTNMDLVNTSSRTYVAWQWKESATAGFDIVTWSGNSTSGRTISHSLGVAPQMIITKSRSNPSSWVVGIGGMSGFGVNDYLTMNTTSAKASSSTFYQAYGSSTFTVGVSAADEMNKTGNNYVSYLFAEVAGFSRFGSYTGNGSTDGPFVYCGFRPAFIMAKDASVTNSWVMYDLRRDPYNVSQNYLIPNSSGAEGVSTSLDITANGFKIRTTGPGALNTSGSTVIFAAFAENPFKNSLAR